MKQRTIEKISASSFFTGVISIFFGILGADSFAPIFGQYLIYVGTSLIVLSIGIMLLRKELLAFLRRLKPTVSNKVA